MHLYICNSFLISAVFVSAEIAWCRIHAFLSKDGHGRLVKLVILSQLPMKVTLCYQLVLRGAISLSDSTFREREGTTTRGRRGTEVLVLSDMCWHSPVHQLLLLALYVTLSLASVAFFGYSEGKCGRRFGRAVALVRGATMTP